MKSSNIMTLLNVSRLSISPVRVTRCRAQLCYKHRLDVKELMRPLY